MRFYYISAAEKQKENPETIEISGFSLVAGVGFEPHDLRVMSSNISVFNRYLMSQKPMIYKTFLDFAFFIVDYKNLTFCVVVEFLLNSK